MDFSDYIQPFIEADTEGNMSFSLVRGGSLVLTDKNTYIIEENTLGELESFEKIDNNEVNSLKVEMEKDLTQLLHTDVSKSLLDEYEEKKSEETSNQELIREIVSETQVDPSLLSKVIDRDEPATMLRIHLDKRSPTYFIDIDPSTFVRKFLTSEIYREKYVNEEADNGI